MKKKQKSAKDVERLSEPDRRRLFLAKARVDKANRALQSGQNAVSRCQIELATAQQDMNEVTQRLVRQHKLEPGSALNPESGAIVRPSAPVAVR